MEKNRKIKIAMLASNHIRIPPSPKYIPKGACGATETIVYQITEELVKRGHEVTLFASGNSKTSAKLESVTAYDSISDKRICIENHRHYEHLLISRAYQMAQKGKFDIIHSHFDIRSAYYPPLIKTPTVSTLHSPLTFFLVQSILKFYKNTQYYVSISDAQRKPLPDLNYIGTVYHGIKIKKIKFSEKGDNNLVFVGRLVPEKGVYEAIQAAKRTKNKLFLLGSMPENSEYWRDKIRPYLSSQIKSPGFVDHKEVLKYLQSAKALLFPIKWEEPFGLVMIEAMACGTPVIAFDRGSVREIIKDGETGFIVKDMNGMVRAIKKIDQIDRKKCRRWVEQNFTVEKMVDRYEKIFEKILRRRKPSKNF